MSKFLFKQFEVAHDKCVFKVGTDSILLGSWITGEYRSVADLGSGCGLLALMCAQKFENAQVLGVEFDELSFLQSVANAKKSPWANRIGVSFEDIRKMDGRTFDLIISNPPYFERQVESPDVRKNKARQESHLSILELFEAANRISHSVSTVAVVFPYARRQNLIESSQRCGWHLREELRVETHPGKQVKLILAKFVKAESEPWLEYLCIMNASGEYSPEFKALTKDFYLDY